jgi:hypothetical protein
MNSKPKRLFQTLRRTLFLDIFLDRRTRPIFLYAVLLIGVGATLFHWLEDWSWLDSFYFVVITLTTIGYGDFSPTTPATKLITIFYGLNGVILLLMFFDVIRQVRGWTIENRRKESEEAEA